MGNAGDIFGSTSTRTTFEDLMKEFGRSGLRFDFLDDIFGDALKGRGFSFKIFTGGAGGAPRGANLKDLFARAQQPPQPPAVNYEITIARKQAAKGMEKDLKRIDKTLRVKIPAKTKDGTKIRLRNALQLTDGQPGDIVITVRVKK